MKCDSKYLDDNYKYPINKEVEFKGYNTLTESFTITTTKNSINTETITSIPTIEKSYSDKKDEL